MNKTAGMIIDRLKLEPLSFEGGYFRQTWSSGGMVAGGTIAGGTIAGGR